MRPNIEEIEERLDKACDAPWEVLPENDWEYSGTVHQPHSVHAVVAECDEPNDAVFIAHAREDIPALLEYIRELEQNESYQEQTINELLDANKKLVEWKRQEEAGEILQAGGPRASQFLKDLGRQMQEQAEDELRKGVTIIRDDDGETD